MVEVTFRLMTLDIPLWKSEESLHKEHLLCTQILKTLTCPIDTLKKIEHIASIGALGDTLIGQTVAKGLEIAGDEGYIFLEEASGGQTYISTSEGLEIACGYLNEHFLAKGKVIELHHPQNPPYKKHHSLIRPIIPLVQTFIGSNSLFFL